MCNYLPVTSAMWDVGCKFIEFVVPFLAAVYWKLSLYAKYHYISYLQVIEKVVVS